MGILCSCPCCYCCPSIGCCGWKGPNHEISLQNPDWIKHLTEANPNLKLRDAVILGSHDSATSSISEFGCCSSLAITTRLSIYEQLMAGVRSLDIRLGQNGEQAHQVFIWHGPIMGGRFCTSVKKENNKETVPAKFGEGVEGKPNLF